MSPLVFLGIALVLSFLGVLALWMRHRPPKSVDAHIRAFSRELEALAPDPETFPPKPRPDVSRAPMGRPEPMKPGRPQPKRPGPVRTGPMDPELSTRGPADEGPAEKGPAGPDLKRGRRSG